MNLTFFAHPGHEHVNEVQAATHHLPAAVLIGVITAVIILAMFGVGRLFAKAEADRTVEDDEA